ncbi:type II secretion system protein [Paucibacter soli]|uniref:type II secretion system protein n=1 Tax=Paucibacter soli TaxID=3133433 RepID=UPI0030A73C1D
MRTGEKKLQPGFTYLGMLFFVAITSAALAALGQHWSTAAQRERERELEFRGQEIARAIESYLLASPSQPPNYPHSFEDLLRDGRGIKPRHHLRRVYADPFTGKPDWVLLAAPADPRGFEGVRSRSEQVLLRQLGDAGSPASHASDWLFKTAPAQAKPDPTAPAASAPGP